MAKKGARTTQKRISAERAVKIARKKSEWAIAFSPGTHAKSASVPLGFALRDLLGIAQTLKEVKAILNSSQVLVDGKVRKSYGFGIGLFDLIEIKQLKKRYRALLDKKGRVFLKEIGEKEKPFKLCKVVGKHAAKGKKILLQTNDGRSFLLEKSELSPGDSVKIGFPEKKIIDSFKLEKGCTAFVLGGKHVGSMVRVKEIAPSSMRKQKLVTVEGKEGEFQTAEKNIFVVGSKKPEVELDE